MIAGDTGGTGASPLTSIKHAGVPWELGIAETHQTLVMNHLRSRVVLQTDGQLKTGRDPDVSDRRPARRRGVRLRDGAAGRARLHHDAQMPPQHLPVGIATQDPALRRKFAGAPEHVVNYLFMVARDLRRIMAGLGFRTVNEMIGRVDALRAAPRASHWKARDIDVAALLAPAPAPEDCLGGVPPP